MIIDSLKECFFIALDASQSKDSPKAKSQNGSMKLDLSKQSQLNEKRFQEYKYEWNRTLATRFLNKVQADEEE